MTSASNTTSSTQVSNCSDNTTFVRADPSTFQTIVQQLTGSPFHHNYHHDHDQPHTKKLPLSRPGLRRPAFKLQERRKATKNLHINLKNTNNDNVVNIKSTDYFNSLDKVNVITNKEQTIIGMPLPSPSSSASGFLISPVSTLDFFATSYSSSSTSRVSPRSPCELRSKPPELLSLFPLSSRGDSINHQLVHRLN